MKGVLGARAANGNLPQFQAYGYRLEIILNAFTWFLEKLALRGEISWADPSVPLEEHLEFFEKIILRSFDLLEQDADKRDTP